MVSKNHFNHYTLYDFVTSVSKSLEFIGLFYNLIFSQEFY